MAVITGLTGCCIKKGKNQKLSFCVGFFFSAYFFYLTGFLAVISALLPYVTIPRCNIRYLTIRGGSLITYRYRAVCMLTRKSVTFGGYSSHPCLCSYCQMLLKPLDSLISSIPLSEISNIPMLKCHLALYRKKKPELMQRASPTSNLKTLRPP